LQSCFQTYVVCKHKKVVKEGHIARGCTFMGENLMCNLPVGVTLSRVMA